MGYKFSEKTKPSGVCQTSGTLRVVSLPVVGFSLPEFIDHLLTKFVGATSLNKEPADDFVAGNFPLNNGDSIDCKMFL